MPTEERTTQPATLSHLTTDDALTQRAVSIPEPRKSAEIDDLEPYNLPFTD